MAFFRGKGVKKSLNINIGEEDFKLISFNFIINFFLSGPLPPTPFLIEFERSGWVILFSTGATPSPFMESPTQLFNMEIVD